MRPLFHKSDNGLKAHIFLCVLTLLIEKLINKAVPEMTTRQVITELKKIKLSKTNDFLIRTELTEVQKDILKKLEIQEPAKMGPCS
jgi:transposase